MCPGWPDKSVPPSPPPALPCLLMLLFPWLYGRLNWGENRFCLVISHSETWTLVLCPLWHLALVPKGADAPGIAERPHICARWRGRSMRILPGLLGSSWLTQAQGGGGGISPLLSASFRCQLIQASFLYSQLQRWMFTPLYYAAAQTPRLISGVCSTCSAAQTS